MPPGPRIDRGGDGKNVSDYAKPVPFKLYVDREEYDVDKDYSFAPFFPPNEFIVRKKRNQETEDNLCEGQTVTDNGGKNRTIHVSGILSGVFELMAFDEIVELEKPFEVNTMGAAWEGEVRIKEGEYRGPVGTDTRSNGRDEKHWKYTLRLISTGRDEYDNHMKDGILEEADSA